MNKYRAIKNIKERQSQFLYDTIHHYNSNNRCVDDIGQCYYHPTSKNTKGCAIGRHLAKKLAKQMDNGEFGVPSMRSNPNIFERLPVWMKEMGRDFLMEVQSLHDGLPYWDGNGLSGAGLYQVDALKVKFGFNVNALN